MDRDDPLLAVAARYAIAITPAMEAQIDVSDPADPIAAQFRPDARELHSTAAELIDPIGDSAHSPVPGIVHRYSDRALLIPTHLCAVYCRFCFRREQVGPGPQSMLAPDALKDAFAYIEATPALWEIIVTGGDPLVLSDRRIAEISARLAAIPHVKVIRWHTRAPVVAPERITPTLVEALKAPGKTVWLAVHANHPREFTPEGDAAIARLIDAGIPLLSQSVLLKGVNDHPETLEALMRGFVERRIKPYYLHHLDLAPGTSHFRVDIPTGQAIADALRARASGLCQPTYVLDIPGGIAKAPLAQASVRVTPTGHEVRDPKGAWRAYPLCPATE